MSGITHGDPAPAEGGTGASGQARAGGAVGDGHDARSPLGGDGHAGHGRMHVKSVADDLGCHILALKHRPDQARVPMVHG